MIQKRHKIFDTSDCYQIISDHGIWKWSSGIMETFLLGEFTMTHTFCFECEFMCFKLFTESIWQCTWYAASVEYLVISCGNTCPRMYVSKLWATATAHESDFLSKPCITRCTQGHLDAISDLFISALRDRTLSGDQHIHIVLSESRCRNCTFQANAIRYLIEGSKKSAPYCQILYRKAYVLAKSEHLLNTWPSVYDPRNVLGDFK